MEINNILNKIVVGECISEMKKLPSESLDGIITSPPYNLKIRKTFNNTENWKGKWNKSKLQSEGYDNYSDYLPEDQYISGQKEALSEMLRLIKPTGAIFYNHKWRVQNNQFQMRPQIIEGLPLRQIIIWKKPGGINFNENYFLPTYEIIYLIAKEKFKLPPKINAFTDVWSITPTKGSWHPAPFPDELAEKCVQAITGDIVLDPYMGSGTTARACKKYNKNYIGIDISESYATKAAAELGTTIFKP